MGVVEDAIRKQHPHGSLNFWLDIEITRGKGVRGAAKRLGVSPRSLYRWIAAHGFTVRMHKVYMLVKKEGEAG